MTKFKDQSPMPQQTKVPVSKYQASLLGGAIGDALGAPIEFMGIEEIRSKFGPAGVKDYVEFSDGRGVFTDDTQMTLFTAEALLRAYHQGISARNRRGFANHCTSLLFALAIHTGTAIF